MSQCDLTTSTKPAIANVANFQKILELASAYLEGLHYADLEKLREIFHPDASLNAPGLRLSFEEWLNKVANRPTPATGNTTPPYRILSLEIHEHEAMLKIECPLFDFFYIDYLNLLFESGRWRIVNKMYAHQTRMEK